MGYDDREEEYYHKQYEGQKNELFEHDESQGTSHHQKYNPNEEELCCGWENFKPCSDWVDLVNLLAVLCLGVGLVCTVTASAVSREEPDLNRYSTARDAERARKEYALRVEKLDLVLLFGMLFVAAGGILTTILMLHGWIRQKDSSDKNENSQISGQKSSGITTSSHKKRRNLLNSFSPSDREDDLQMYEPKISDLRQQEISSFYHQDSQFTSSDQTKYLNGHSTAQQFNYGSIK
ncbi:uncharacterized protein LOC142354062 [Convolutriloba macropyga]|uniref:uncharacterized protein LOC142354062 n=1 Tax=Convolutriloba macropyga TaxID=536237 RepID=UPI003F522098